MSLVDRRSAGDASASAPTVYVCVTCRPPGEPESAFRPGEALARSTATAAEGSEVAVVRVKCLGVCTRPPTAALRAPGAWTYVFGELAPDIGADLVEGARQLAHAEDGVLPWRGRPKPLKRGMIARVPPIGFVEDPSEETE